MLGHGRKRTFTVPNSVTACKDCNFTKSNKPAFLTATKEELSKLPPISKELEDDLRIVARILRKRVEEDFEKQLLQVPIKRTIVEVEGEKDG